MLRRSHSIAFSYSSVCILATPANNIQREAKVSSGLRRSASSTWLSVSSPWPSRYFASPSIACALARLALRLSARSHSIMPRSTRRLEMRTAAIRQCAHAWSGADDRASLSRLSADSKAPAGLSPAQATPRSVSTRPIPISAVGCYFFCQISPPVIADRHAALLQFSRIKEVWEHRTGITRRNN